MLAPEIGLLADPDVAGLGRSLGAVFRGAMGNPAEAAAAWAPLRAAPRADTAGRVVELAGGPAAAAGASSTRRTAVSPTAPGRIIPLSTRCGCPTRRSPSSWTRLVTAARLDRIQETKARLMTGLLVDALAPTNFLPTNPAALKPPSRPGARASRRAHATSSTTCSTTAGARVRWTPALHLRPEPRGHAGQGRLPQRPDGTAAVPAADAASAPAPLLCSPPWINKYYVMDLAPRRSFIEWAVQHERTVFAISYRNPSADMAGVTHGRLSHPRPPAGAGSYPGDHQGGNRGHRRIVPGRGAHRDHRRLPQATGQEEIGNLTLLNTMLDYSEPGVLGAFTDIGHGPAARGRRWPRRAIWPGRPWPGPSISCGPTT